MSPTQPADPQFELLLEFIKESRGFDYTGYKRPSLARRFQKRMQAVRVETFPDYQRYLAAHPDEFSQLFDTILINVTSFFRDPATWDYLGVDVIPRIVASRTEGQDVRAWSTGCATGEEAYTLAMLFGEAAGEDALKDGVKIYATDVDEDALRLGRHGNYSEKQMAPVPSQLR